MFSLELIKYNIKIFVREHFQANAAINGLNGERNKFDLIVNFEKNIDILIEQSLLDLLQESKLWEISLSSGIIENNKLLLQINRSVAFLVMFKAILTSEAPYGCREFNNKSFAVTCSDSKGTHLTVYRQSLLCNIARNLLIFGGYHMTSNADIEVLFTTKSNSNGIYCAPVHSIQSSGNDITVESYLKVRENDMRSIAQHKYWDSSENTSVKVLAEASVIIDLISVKHSNVVKLNTDDKTVTGTREMSNKGGAFLLYNLARLESIEKKFNENLMESRFPHLPDLEEIDWSLLSQQEEWRLLFNYIMEYPSVLSRTIGNITEKKIGQHHLCDFLFKFCQIFSMYYCRYRILQEPRPHLLPVMFARLYLAKTINKVLKQSLQIMNINLLECM